jgi:hypothetical protein
MTSRAPMLGASRRARIGCLVARRSRFMGPVWRILIGTMGATTTAFVGHMYPEWGQLFPIWVFVHARKYLAFLRVTAVVAHKYR